MIDTVTDVDPEELEQLARCLAMAPVLGERDRLAVIERSTRRHRRAGFELGQRRLGRGGGSGDPRLSGPGASGRGRRETVGDE